MNHKSWTRATRATSFARSKVVGKCFRNSESFRSRNHRKQKRKERKERSRPLKTLDIENCHECHECHENHENERYWDIEDIEDIEVMNPERTSWELESWERGEERGRERKRERGKEREEMFKHFKMRTTRRGRITFPASTTIQLPELLSRARRICHTQHWAGALAWHCCDLRLATCTRFALTWKETKIVQLFLTIEGQMRKEAVEITFELTRRSW